jgi:hypothetical protein
MSRRFFGILPAAGAIWMILCGMLPTRMSQCSAVQDARNGAATKKALPDAGQDVPIASAMLSSYSLGEVARGGTSPLKSRIYE